MAILMASQAQHNNHIPKQYNGNHACDEMGSRTELHISSLLETKGHPNWVV
jgi:hypothetical protein